MNNKMTLERATAFGESWNSGDPDLVASYFAEDGVFHGIFGSERLGQTFTGRAAIREEVKAIFDRFPTGRFEDLKVLVHGDYGWFEWDYSIIGADGNRQVTAGCDLLEFDGDMVKVKNAFQKVRPSRTAA